MRLAAFAAALLLAGCVTAPAPPETPGATFDWFRYSGDDPLPPGQSVGAGDYRNPILTGFYPDPSLTRVGDDYYLVTSTFAYFPGIPVFHSRDLVSWRQIGNAIDRPDQLDFGRLGLSRGVFAPDISWNAGTFYILNTCVDCGGNFLITATDPAGPWSDPVWLPDLEGGIDPSLFFDEDGRAWIVNNGPPQGTPLYEGHRAIWIQEFDPRAKRTIGARTMLVNGGVDLSTRPIWIEGPHILRREGHYYLICAEGGTAEGHSQVVLRSEHVTGPYLPYAGNPILTQRDLPRDRAMPITSAGHADLVETRTGEWWATFLAVRPYADDYYNTGRETFLMPVRWVGGWPRITEPGQAIPYAHRRPNLPADRAGAQPPAELEEFDGTSLPPSWLMLRNPRERWYALRNGALQIEARPVRLGANANPSFLARRQQHMHAQAETLVRFRPQRDGDRAGLAAFQNDDFWYFIGLASEGGRPVVTLARRAGPNEPADGLQVASAPLALEDGRPLYLRIVADAGTYRFYYAERPGAWRQLGPGQDGTILSTKTAGGFVGAVFGLHAFSNAG
ncbi:MAG TPA: glycoside hydrolase family 43 protein [Allosphingosinicella sp.]|nr:glycoside hydrolase family 43 protein [Allosphingosinicella sp.]